MPQETPEDRKFHVVLSAIATELVEGPGNSPSTEKPFANETIEFHDMSYVDVVVIEQIWGQLHEHLAQLGPERVNFWLQQGGSPEASKVALMGKFANKPEEYPAE